MHVARCTFPCIFQSSVLNNRYQIIQHHHLADPVRYGWMCVFLSLYVCVCVCIWWYFHISMQKVCVCVYRCAHWQIMAFRFSIKSNCLWKLPFFAIITNEFFSLSSFSFEFVYNFPFEFFIRSACAPTTLHSFHIANIKYANVLVAQNQINHQIFSNIQMGHV